MVLLIVEELPLLLQQEGVIHFVLWLVVGRVSFGLRFAQESIMRSPNQIYGGDSDISVVTRAGSRRDISAVHQS